jgi:type IV pilus assembly protein PilM
LGRFSSSVGVVGVDFGASAIKLLQLRERAGQVEVLGAARINSPGIHASHLPARLVEHLRGALSSGGFVGRKCVVSLPRAAVHLQAVRLPRMSDGELKQAATWEASQRFNLPRTGMQADFMRTGAVPGAGEAREEILLLAASHDSIHACVDPLMQAGLRPMAIETSFAALERVMARRYRREIDRSVVRAVLDIGESGTTFFILRGDAISFCKSIEIGGTDLDQAVAEHLQLDIAAAHELRARRLAAAVGAADSSPDHAERTAHRLSAATAGVANSGTDRAVFEAVRPLLGEIVREVMMCLRYFGVTFRGQPPQRIIVTGGDGLEPGFDRMLEDGCKVPFARDDESRTLGAIEDQLRTVLGAECGPAGSWAVAAGLSLRGMRAGESHRFRRAGATPPADNAAPSGARSEAA